MSRTQNRKRKTFNAQERREHVKQWLRSGLSAQDYGTSSGVAPANLWRWKRERQAVHDDTSTAFRELVVRSTASPRKTADEQSPSPIAELTFGSGVRMRVFRHVDANWLQTVVRIMEPSQ